MNRSEQTPKHGYSTCPYCGVNVREDRLNHHIKKVHLHQPILQNQKAPKVVRKPALHGNRYSIISCPQCGASIYKRHLGKHIEQFHTIFKTKGTQPYPKNKNKLPRNPSQQKSSNTKNSGKIYYIDKNGLITSRELLFGDQKPSKPLYERLAPGAQINQGKELRGEESAYQRITKVSETRKTTTSGNDLLQCPCCPSPVKRKNIWNHVCNHHPGKNPEDAMTGIKPYQRRKSI